MKVSAVSAAAACLISDGARTWREPLEVEPTSLLGDSGVGGAEFLPSPPASRTRVDGNKVAPEGQ